MKPILPTLFTISLFFGLLSCQDTQNKPGGSESGKPVVLAANYPLFYFAERIAGDLIDLRYPVDLDVDPAFWDPKDEDIAAFQNADLILMNGATYSKWAEKVSLPKNTQVNTSKSFSRAYVTEEGSKTHSHGNGEVHAHTGIAFTTWLNMEFARLQAEAIRDRLMKRLPDSHDTLAKNAESLFADLDSLDASLKQTGAKLDGMPLLGSHPVYQYLARRYNLKIRSVHWEPEVVPNEGAMAEIAEIRTEHPAAMMIWEGDPVTESEEKLTALGIQSVVFSPCGNRPESGDWLSVMKQNAVTLSEISK